MEERHRELQPPPRSDQVSAPGAVKQRGVESRAKLTRVQATGSEKLCDRGAAGPKSGFAVGKPTMHHTLKLGSSEAVLRFAAAGEPEVLAPSDHVGAAAFAKENTFSTPALMAGVYVVPRVSGRNAGGGISAGSYGGSRVTGGGLLIGARLWCPRGSDGGGGGGSAGPFSLGHIDRALDRSGSLPVEL